MIHPSKVHLHNVLELDNQWRFWRERFLEGNTSILWEDSRIRWSRFWWLIYTQKYINKPIWAILGRGVNFPLIPLIKTDVVCNIQCTNDGGNDEASCLDSISWNIYKFFACDLTQKISSLRYFHDGPCGDERSVVGSVNVHSPGCFFNSLVSFFWGLLWGPLELVPRCTLNGYLSNDLDILAVWPPKFSKIHI